MDLGARAGRCARGWRAAGGAFVLACAALAAGVAAAEEPPPEPPPGGAPRFHRDGPPPFEKILERHAVRLGLGDETRAEIRRIADAARPEGERLRAALGAERRRMRDLLGADTPDEAAVMAQAERIGGAETAVQKHRLRTMLEIRAILTPEQRAELVKIHAERKERWQMRGGGGPAPGPPPEAPPGPE